MRAVRAVRAARLGLRAWLVGLWLRERELVAIVLLELAFPLPAVDLLPLPALFFLLVLCLAVLAVPIVDECFVSSGACPATGKTTNNHVSRPAR